MLGRAGDGSSHVSPSRGDEDEDAFLILLSKFHTNAIRLATSGPRALLEVDLVRSDDQLRTRGSILAEANNGRSGRKERKRVPNSSAFI